MESAGKSVITRKKTVLRVNPYGESTCNKVGHWSRVCRTKKAVSEVTEQQQSYFLGAVSKAADGSSEQ